MSVAIIKRLKRTSPALRKINVHIYLTVRKQTELDRTPSLVPLFFFIASSSVRDSYLRWQQPNSPRDPLGVIVRTFSSSGIFLPV